MKKTVFPIGPSFAVAFLCFMVLPGCGGKDMAKNDVAPLPLSATEMLQKELISLRIENDSLKRHVAALEQTSRTTTALAAELESELKDLKDRLSRPEPQPVIAEDPQKNYNDALDLFRSRNYSAAIKILRALIGSEIPDGLRDNCYYWLGECSFGMHRYSDGINFFKQVLTYRISEKKDESQLMIANSYLAMGNRTLAKDEFENFLRLFPASPYAKKVQDRLRAM